MDFELDVHVAPRVIFVRVAAEIPGAEGFPVEVGRLPGTPVEAEVGDHAAHHGGIRVGG